MSASKIGIGSDLLRYTGGGKNVVFKSTPKTGEGWKIVGAKTFQVISVMRDDVITEELPNPFFPHWNQLGTRGIVAISECL